MFDRLKPMGVFAKVAELGSFVGAAKALGITAPVVSQHISQLEKDLGVALVYRSTRSLRLTDAGERFAISARKMLEAAQSGIDDITDDEVEPHGKLSIAAPGISDYEPFLDGITEYMAKFPLVELTISFDDKTRDIIREGFDLGIRGGSALKDSNLMSKKLIDFPRIIVCTPQYLERFRPVKKPEDLKKNGLKWIGGPAKAKTARLIKKNNPSEYREIPTDHGICVDSYNAGINFALRHNGLITISTMDNKHLLSDGTFVEPLPDWQYESMSIYAVWPANAGTRSLTRHFLNYLLNNINQRKT